MKIDFEHNMSAHCENGVTANLLNFYGIQLSEAMIFGLGSGLFFTYMPFMKLNGAPVVSFRPLPGLIFKRVNKALGVKTKTLRFPRNPEKAMRTLDKKLKQNIPVGMVVGVYHLSYFPAPYRFHFNAHNIVVFEKNNNTYTVSDPIMENIEYISYNDLKLVRYAKGTYKPKGKMYYITSVNKNYDLPKAIKTSLKKTAKFMVVYPGQIIGYKAMLMLARDIRRWPQKYDKRKAAKYLGSVVRMQEEIGTGGAGFRFMYAAFLQEAAITLNNKELHALAKEMTEIGDKWRLFATNAARIVKNRNSQEITYNSTASLLEQIAEAEKKLFKKILKLNL